MQSSDTATASTEPVDRPPSSRMDADASRSAGAALPTRKILLGEELPIFCEKCGYALHGLEQQICPQCSIRHFHCPECGHHQPINTLRPAAQKLLGRIRAFFLALSVFFKLNFFGWLLVAWVNLGYEMSYNYVWVANSNGYGSAHLEPQGLSKDAAIGFTLFGSAFGMVGRMLLLRWRRGYLVGAVLATLVFAALVLGAYLYYSSRSSYGRLVDRSTPNPLTGDFILLGLLAAGTLLLAASTVWGIWSALVFIFLPKRTGQALLDWQSNQSTPAVSHLSRQ